MVNPKIRLKASILLLHPTQNDTEKYEKSGI